MANATGKWKVVNGQEILQFFGGGNSGTAVRVTSGLFGAVESQGTFDWLDGTSVRLQFPALFGSESTIYTVSFEGDRMRLLTPSGARIEYQRQ